MDAVWMILAMVALLLLEGFFSGSEMALVNADKIRLHARANQGHKGARLVLQMFERPDVLLTTTLVGTNIAVVVFTTLATLAMIRLFGEYGDLYAFLIFTPLLLTLGEIVPKSVYQQNADRLAPVVIHPLRLFRLLLYPVIAVFSLVARLAALLAGGHGAAHNLFITRQQIRTVVEMANRGAHVDVFDHARIRRAARFADTSVGEAMVPLAEIIAIDRRYDTRTAFGLVRRHGYNRLPVYERNTGNVVGVVTLTVWDLMDRELEERPLEELIKPALYVSPLQNIDEVLPLLREREDHMAIVVDEFGSAIGMIRMEDILEEVVGEIKVGYDFDEIQPRRRRSYQQIEEGVYLVDSRVSVAEINELLEIQLPSTEFHTVGGFVESRLRRIPATGESVVESGWRFVVEQTTDRAIIRLRVERILT
ncbi:MAG: HlyC/CorC family transporter [Thiogranum sp.]|nr:HlyC/CorC family transporter [Thiogranum sp.]